jgi:hypothetical protein
MFARDKDDCDKKIEICRNPVKHSFKVWLNSNNASSWSGTQFNASYVVDFKRCIREVWRLGNAWQMRFEFVSIASTTAVSTVTNTKVYTLHIDLGKGTPSMYQFNSIRTPSGIIRVSTDGTGVYVNPAAAASFDIPVYFNSRPLDNDPVFFEDLLNVSTVSLNLIDTSAGATFNSSDTGSVNNATKYICCLHFEEV